MCQRIWNKKKVLHSIDSNYALLGSTLSSIFLSLYCFLRMRARLDCILEMCVGLTQDDCLYVVSLSNGVIRIQSLYERIAIDHILMVV